jgi:hypothetical protein
LECPIFDKGIARWQKKTNPGAGQTHQQQQQLSLAESLANAGMSAIAETKAGAMATAGTTASNRKQFGSNSIDDIYCNNRYGDQQEHTQ